MLNNELVILKIEHYNFREGPNFVTKEVHYHPERKRSYLKSEDKPRIYP